MELADEAPVGEDFRVYLGLDDVSIDIDLTPNRSDCLGVAGVAREVGVLTSTDVCQVNCDEVKASSDKTFPVKVSATAACPRYLGRVIENVNPQAETPVWMQEKLRRSGLRSLGPVVDVTNYVMLELGQPMHAFDLDKLNNGISVRLSQDGDKLTLLVGLVVGNIETALVFKHQIDKAFHKALNISKVELFQHSFQYRHGDNEWLQGTF